MDQLIPIVGIICGCGVGIAAFVWLYKESKIKSETIIEISKNVQDPAEQERLIRLLDSDDDDDEEDKTPEGQKKSAIITISSGIGLALMFMFFDARPLIGVGLLVTIIGLGLLINASYFTSKE